MDNQYKVSKIKKGILLYSGFKILLGRVFLKFFFSTVGAGGDLGRKLYKPNMREHYGKFLAQTFLGLNTS